MLRQEDIARDTEVSEATVSTMLRRYEPVTHALKAVRRDLFTSTYQMAALTAVDELYAAKAKGTLTAGDARNWAVTSAVFAEKALLFAGQPTQIVAGLHEVRVELPALMARLAEVGQRMRQIGPGAADRHEAAPDDAVSDAQVVDRLGRV